MCEPFELRRAQRVIERTADQPAAFLSREVSDAGDPTWDHAALELDFEQPAQREGTGVHEADAVRQDVLHLGQSRFGFGNQSLDALADGSSADHAATTFPAGNPTPRRPLR